MAHPKADPSIKIITENRRALFRYEIDERIEVGIVLAGSEVKSLRAGRCELGDAYAMVRDGQLELVNMYIAPYAFAHMVKHAEKGTRRLLAKRAEIDRLDGKTAQRGYTLVALKAYFSHGKVKIELGLARGRDGADKRQAIKEREGKREAEAAMTRALKR